MLGVSVSDGLHLIADYRTDVGSFIYELSHGLGDGESIEGLYVTVVPLGYDGVVVRRYLYGEYNGDVVDAFKGSAIVDVYGFRYEGEEYFYLFEGDDFSYSDVLSMREALREFGFPVWDGDYLGFEVGSGLYGDFTSTVEELLLDGEGLLLQGDAGGLWYIPGYVIRGKYFEGLVRGVYWEIDARGVYSPYLIIGGDGELPDDSGVYFGFEGADDALLIPAYAPLGIELGCAYRGCMVRYIEVDGDLFLCDSKGIRLDWIRNL